MLHSILDSGLNEAVAVTVPEGPTVTYEELNSEVERTAGVLAATGLEPGDTISLILGNNLEFLVCFLAIARAGAVAAPLNPAYTREELSYYMKDAGSQLVLGSPYSHGGKEAAGSLGIAYLEAGLFDGEVKLFSNGAELKSTVDVAHPADSATALFLHTSGTTSRPKGVPLTHANLLASVRNISQTYGLTAADVAMVVMPLFHVHGLIGVALSTLGTGGAVVLPPRFSASGFWALKNATETTWYSAVPTIHKILLDRSDLDSAPGPSERNFRFIRSCSSPMSTTIIEAMEDRFGVPVLEAYGMTEASHQMSSNPLPPGHRRPGSVGVGTGVSISIRNELGVEVPIGDLGEVCIRGSNVMHGYSDNPEANATAFWDGWFRTGDQGFLSKDLYLTLTGRLKELINRGGEKISPVEVDEVLLTHPMVSEAVSFAVPDPKYGECVQAAVVLRGDATEEEIKMFCSGSLAAFKVPDSIHITDELPRTVTGKIQRRHVAAKFTD